MQIILVKLALNVTEQCQTKENVAVSFPGKTPLKLQNNAPLKKSISIPYLLQAKPGHALLLLACYCDSTKLWG